MFNINLIPWRAEERRQKLSYLGGLIFLGLAILLFGWWGGDAFLKKNIAQLKDEIAVLEKDLQHLKEQEGFEQEKLRKIELIKSGNALLKVIKLNNKKVYHNLRELLSQVPGTVKFLELNYIDGKWSLQGIAKDRGALLDWAKLVQIQAIVNKCQFRKWEVNDDGINFLLKEDH